MDWVTSRKSPHQWSAVGTARVPFLIAGEDYLLAFITFVQQRAASVNPNHAILDIEVDLHPRDLVVNTDVLVWIVRVVAQAVANGLNLIQGD